MAKIKVKLNVIYSIRKNKQATKRTNKHYKDTQYLQIKHNEVDIDKSILTLRWLFGERGTVGSIGTRQRTFTPNKCAHY